MSKMYRRPCLWSYENIVSSNLACGGWVFNNFVWRVSNFEWNDQLRGYISAELLRAKLLWRTWEDRILAKIFIIDRDGVILTFMLSYILYGIIFPEKNIPLPSVENKWSPKITKKILRWVWLALLDFWKNIQKYRVAFPST